MKRSAVHLCGIMFFVAAVVLPAAALNHPLSAKEILDAYSIGHRKDTNTARFLAGYIRYFPRPESGPHVATIRMETPYFQIVERASDNPGYDAQQAQNEFLGKFQVVRILVRIALTPTYSRLLPSPPDEFRWRPPDFWREFKIRLIQGQEIPPQTVHGQPEYGGAQTPDSLTGAMVAIEYDAAKIQSEPAKVEVLTPDGQHIEARFNFKSLK